MLMIRMARFGKKKQPYYRLVVSEKIHTPTGRNVEFVGTYNPKNKEVSLKEDRVKHWLENGAGYSRTVGMLLMNNGLLKKEDMPTSYFTEKKRPNKKAAIETAKEGANAAATGPIGSVPTEGASAEASAPAPEATPEPVVEAPAPEPVATPEPVTTPEAEAAPVAEKPAEEVKDEPKEEPKEDEKQ